jgi:Protein of unknown function (DUF1488)
MPLVTINDPAVIEGWGVTFAMLDGEKRVRCHVGGDALEDIERSNNPGEAERMQIFERHRETFETIASELYDTGREPRIRSKHLSR